MMSRHSARTASLSFTELRADLRLPPNAGETDLNVTFHGGAIASGVAVELIFWGSAWQQPANSALRAQFVASAASLIGGPYYTALKEYGAAKPMFRGAVTVISPDPPGSFDDGDVGDLVWNCIDANIFPEPDDPGGRIFYAVVMAPGTSYGPGGALGAHSWPHDYDFPFDWDTAWVAWIGFGNLNTLTRVFGHELAEAVTDPEGDGWHTDVSGEEIGDICNTRQGFVNGVWVEGYWSRRMNACVIPTSSDTPVSTVARMSDQLDCFITGNDGRVYTSWWHEGTDWSGINNNWRPIGGFFPIGAPVSTVARESGQLDCFVTGNDGRVYTSWWHERSDWSGINNNWRSIGGFFPAGATVSAVARMSDQLDLFVVGNDGRVYTSWWHEGSDWSGHQQQLAIDRRRLPDRGRDQRNRQGDRPARPVRGRQRRPRLHLVVARRLRLVRHQQQLAIHRRLLPRRRAGDRCRTNERPARPVRDRQRRPRLHLVVARRLRLVRHQQQLAIDRRVLPDRGAGVDGGARKRPTRLLHHRQRRPRLHLVVARRLRLVRINNNWRSIGGFFPAGAPVDALARMSDQLDCFITGNDGRVYTSGGTKAPTGPASTTTGDRSGASSRSASEPSAAGRRPAGRFPAADERQT